MTRKSIELKFALHYVDLGWAVLPLHRPRAGRCSCGDAECTSPGKHPRIRGGVTSATANPETILGWLSRMPISNIGVEMGVSNLVAIDVDPQRGGRVEDLPLTDADRTTPTSLTGGGGVHLLYRAPLDLEISNSGRRLPEGIDVRAGRTYIAAPPSLHVSGQTYSWQPGHAPWDLEPRPLPDALLPMLVIRREPSRCDPARVPSVTDRQAETASSHPYVVKALQDELDRLAQAKEGNRNNTLNEVAFNLGQFIEAGLLQRGEVEPLLYSAARTIGLGEVETQQTIRSGIEAGMRNPRIWPDLR